MASSNKSNGSVVIYAEPPREVGEVVLDERVPSKLDEKTPLITRILDILMDRRFIDEYENPLVRLCLDEAIVNAIRHGNKYDEAKIVHVQLFTNQVEWAIRIEDQGEGFDPADVPDPSDPESLILEGGRGILLMNEFMDEVYYFDGGRGLQLAKRRVTLVHKLLRIPGKVVRKVKRLFG